jgi:membrane protease YdiL (CAAX protease family)
VAPFAVRIVKALVVGSALYVVCTLGSRRLAEGLGVGVVAQLWLSKLALALAAAAIWKATGRSWKDMGLWRGRTKTAPTRWYVGAALAAAAGAIAVTLLHAEHPIAKAFSPIEMIATVWLLSSVTEEFFVRGFVQSLMYVDSSHRWEHGPVDVLASSSLFSAMHAPLLWSSMGIAGSIVVLVVTFVVGLMAANARRRTESLIHPIGVHMVGNIAGAIASSVIEISSGSIGAPG